MLTFGGKKHPEFASEEKTTLYKMYEKRGNRIEELERDLAAAKALLRTYPGDRAGLHLLEWEKRRDAFIAGSKT